MHRFALHAAFRRAEIQFPLADLDPMKKWRCVVCDFEYDEAKGLPDEGIPPGTAWEDVPDSWTCPECGASKADFTMVEA